MTKGLDYGGIWRLNGRGLWDRTLVMFVFTLLIASTISCLGGTGIARAEANSTELTTSPIIRVNNDTDLASLIDSMHWNGAGIATNPYVIRDLVFEPSYGSVAIYIGNTTSCLIISNCSDSANNSVFTGMSAISLFNVTNALLENNQFGHSSAGILLLASNNNTVSHNRCTGSPGGGGIYLHNSSHNIVSYNYLSRNGEGVLLESSSNNTVSNNIFIGNACGIGAIDSNNNAFSNNNCSDNPTGIWLIGAKDNTVSNNNCSGGGITIGLRSSNNSLSGNSGVVSIDSLENGGNNSGEVNGYSTLLFVLVIALLVVVTVLVIKGRRMKR
jgi:parallel beta-helix repeat protein